MKKNEDLVTEKKDLPSVDVFEAITGKKLEILADKNIKPWGVKHSMLNKEFCASEEETHRTLFRRQRDRILYSGGYRRLQDKTQVLAATKSGDHRTRLTHTMEVEQISISLADTFGLNRDLAAAIALGHDVGHTPFGHAVERFLNKKLNELGKGGFSHALQSVRYFKEKEIELSDYIIEGIIKHDTDIYLDDFSKDQFDFSKYSPKKPSCLESQVVYWADKIAYITHDLEDFINSGIYQNAVRQNKGLEKKLLTVLEELTANDTINKNFNAEVVIFIKNIENEMELILKDLNTDKEEFKIVEKRVRELKKYVDPNRKDYIREYKENLLNKVNGLKIAVSDTNDVKIEKIKENINNFYEFLNENYLEIKNLKLRDYIRPILDNLIDNSIKNLNEISSMLDSGKSIVEITTERIEAEENEEKLKEKLQNFDDKKIKSLRKKCYQRGLVISFDKKFYENYSTLRDIINDNYIFSPEIARSDAKAEKIASELFDRFRNNENILPLVIKEKILKIDGDNDSKERIIADYIASMTDKYATEVYNDLNAIGSHYDY